MEGELAALDWSSPWYRDWRTLGERVAGRKGRGSSLAGALNADPQAAALQFVAQDELPAGTAYEAFIYERQRCPTRENLHDFFNGLAWLALPRSKARLNELQAAQIRELGVGGQRGPVRDAITLLDENGALLDAPEPLWEALVAREWRRLFVDLRPLWAQARLLVVGHALLEKLASPRKDLTAHVWCEPAPLEVGLAAADDWLAARCTPQRLAAKPFTPLPVLGVPGWWAANQNFSFYDDSTVFRPRRAGTQRESGRPVRGGP